MSLLIVKCLRLNHLIIFLLVSFCVSVKALDPQKRITQYDIRVFKAKDGLPMNSVFDVLQDSQEYIWIGCQEGLVRYDGWHFEVYNSLKYPSLMSNDFLDISQDRDGNLWLSTQGDGLYKFTGTKFIKFDISSGLSSNNILCSAVDSSNVLWVVTESGVSSLANDSIKTYAFQVDITRKYNNSILFDHENRLYLGGSKPGIHYLSGDTIATIQLGNEIVTALYKKRSNEILAGTTSGKLFVLKGDTVRPFEFPQLPSINTVRDIHEDRDGNLWICQENVGILRYCNGKYSILSVENGLPLDNNFLMSVIEDREGSLWFASEGGLCQIFDNKFLVFGIPEGLIVEAGASISQDNEGNMWLGQRDGGVSKFNNFATELLLRRDGLVSNSVKSVLSARDGSIWLGTDKGLNHLKNGQIFSFDEKNGLPETFINALYEDTKANLWIGTNNGYLVRYDGKSFYPIQIAKGESGSVISILQDTNGKIWAGTFNEGLYQITNDSIKHFQETDGFDATGINALYEDNNGVIWIATDRKGIYRYSNKRFFNYSPRDGLSFPRVYSITEDDYGYFWFHGNSGIFRISRTQLEDFYTRKIPRLTCQTFDFRDGMRETECNGRRQPSVCKDSNGRIWFAAVAGVVSIDPGNIKSNEILPPVYIEQFIANNKIIQVSAETLLNPSDRNVEFSYTALSFVTPERVLFQYQLEGYDNNWIDAGNRRSAFYTNLPRGEYTFRVKACNNDGVWNETGAAITFTIPPFWFETWWAKSIFGILAMLALVLASRMYIRKNLDRQHMRLKAEQATRLEQLDRMKTRFFANISHEFRTPLTLILGPLEQFLAGKLPSTPENDYRIMHRNALRLQGLINQLLDLSKLDEGGLKLQAQPTEIGRMLKTLCQSFLSLAEQLGVQLHLDFPGTEQVVYLDREKFEKILTNILSNTFKFTPKGGVVQVRLRLHLPSDDDPGSDVSFVEIEIRDTGIGITQEQLPHIFDRFYQADAGQNRVQEGSGIGLALARELVELHHGDIRVASEPGKGTTFFIKLPTGKSHLQDEEIISENLPEVHDFQPAVRDIFAAEKVAASSTTNLVVSESAPLVLIVEDNADLRYYLRSRLSDNYRIAEAENGQKGIAIAQESMPDLVISDVMMPETDGFELCRRLKTDERTSHIPVILLTALAAPENKLEGLENRADDYIVKPFSCRRTSGAGA